MKTYADFPTIADYWEWCAENGITPDLRRADLRCANLAGKDLTGKNLLCANLTDANLGNAILAGADMQGANLTNANLENVILTDANLRYANLIGADMRHANLEGADMRHTILIDAKLEGAQVFWRDVSDISSDEYRALIANIHLDGDNTRYLKIFCGCFVGTIAEFETAVLNNPKHSANSGYHAIIEELRKFEATYK